MEEKRQQSATEELANALSHGIGALLAIGGLTMLVFNAILLGNAWYIASFTIYGVTLVLLYVSSTLYHSFAHTKWKSVFRIIDHSSIFLLIAGTYTPFTLTVMRGPWGWTIFAMVWGIALSGIIIKILLINRLKYLSLGLYIAMGWLIVVAVKPLIEKVETISLVFLLIGGLLYTSGTIFYARKRLRFGHTIWHMFVLSGSISHFFAVYFLLPT
ncbi:MAG: PAQR family membrane homeostasis protein TrhA [Bacteroidota bacterium]